MTINHGRADLVLEQRQARSAIAHQYSQAPLQWLGPVPVSSSELVYYLRNPNGGLLDGDRHHVKVELGSQTHLEIRTQGATRLHPGRAQQITEITLHPHSTLIWISHPLIPGAESCFHQQVSVQMDPTARLAYGEVWTAGRIAMGECWQFRHLTLDLQVWLSSDPAMPLWWERTDLDYPHERVRTEGVLGDWTCWGSLYLLGDWDPVEWAVSETRWSLSSPDPRCNGQILRQVGDQAMSIWSVFRDTLSWGRW